MNVLEMGGGGQPFYHTQHLTLGSTSPGSLMPPAGSVPFLNKCLLAAAAGAIHHLSLGLPDAVLWLVKWWCACKPHNTAHTHPRRHTSTSLQALVFYGAPNPKKLSRSTRSQESTQFWQSMGICSNLGGSLVQTVTSVILNKCDHFPLSLITATFAWSACFLPLEL